MAARLACSHGCEPPPEAARGQFDQNGGWPVTPCNPLDKYTPKEETLPSTPFQLGTCQLNGVSLGCALGLLVQEAAKIDPASPCRCNRYYKSSTMPSLSSFFGRLKSPCLFIHVRMLIYNRFCLLPSLRVFPAPLCPVGMQGQHRIQ